MGVKVTCDFPQNVVCKAVLKETQAGYAIAIEAAKNLGEIDDFLFVIKAHLAESELFDG